MIVDKIISILACAGTIVCAVIAVLSYLKDKQS